MAEKSKEVSLTKQNSLERTSERLRKFYNANPYTIAHVPFLCLILGLNHPTYVNHVHKAADLLAETGEVTRTGKNGKHYFGPLCQT